jgi:ABC-2 type transport system ATP-binding protein
VARNVIAEVLASVLANHAIEDVSVEDPPLEEVIAQVFARAAPRDSQETELAAAGTGA